MSRHRRLIPLLAAALVIQSLVVVLPHMHGSALDGRAWQAPSHIDATHHCLACSVHAPVVEPTVEFSDAAGTTITSPVPVECGSSKDLSTLSFASPRGPPWLV